MVHAPQHTRRDFLRRTTVGSVATLAAPYFVPAHGLGGAVGPAPSDKLGIGVIGTGGMGRGHVGWITGQSDLVLRGVCDVDKRHLKQALDMAIEEEPDQLFTSYPPH